MAYERRFPSQTRRFGPSISQFAQRIIGDGRLTPDFREEAKRLASNQAYIPGSEIPFQPQQHGDVLSEKEGWANVFGDVFEAYSARKAAEAKAKEKEDRDRDIVKAILEAGNLGGGVAGETTPPLPGTIPLESLDPEEFEEQYREQLEGLPSIPDFAQQIATPTMGAPLPGVQPQDALQGAPTDVPTDVQLAQQITPQQMGGAPPGVQPQGVPQGALQGVPTTGPASWQQRFAAFPQFQPSFPQGASVQTFTERQTPSESWQEAYANLAKMHPDAAIEYLDALKATAKSAAPPQPTYENYPAGASIYKRNPTTGELEYETTAPPKPDVMSPERLAQQIEIRQAGVPPTPTPTQAWGKLAQGRNFERAVEIYTAGDNAAAQTQNLVDPLMLALNDPDLYTGPAADVVLGVKKIAGAMGFEVKGIASGELAKTITAKMALDMKTDLPGPMSDSDRQFLVSLPPGLANTREGNVLIAQYYKRKNALLIKYAKMTRDYAAKNGFVDQNHYAAMADWSAANPIFTQDDYDAVEKIMNPTASNTPAAGFPGSGDDTLTDREKADALILEGG